MFERGKVGEIAFNYIYDGKPSIFPKEYLQAIYDDCYVYNLSNLLSEPSYFDIHFENIDDLEPLAGLQYEDFTVKGNNSYLKDCVDKKKLARDIVKNGMYWHFFGYRKNGSKYINAGAHRLISAKLLKEDGEWPEDKKVMVIFTKAPINMNIKSFCSMDIKLNEVKIIRVPMWLIEPSFDIARSDREDIERRYASRNLRFYNDYIVELDAYTIDQIMYGVDTLSIWCREPLFKQNSIGDVIISSDILNSESALAHFKDLVSKISNPDNPMLNTHTEDLFVINKIIAHTDKPQRPIYIAEFAGKDSMAAAIHFVMNDDRPKTILPIASFSLHEYGNIDSINKCYMDFIDKCKDKDVEILPLMYYTDTNLYRTIKEELSSIAREAKDRYGISIECILCHFYLHLLRARLAKNTISKTVITGERSFHDANIKINQNDKILDIYKDIFMIKGVTLLQSVRDIKDTADINGLVGEEFAKQIVHVKCDYSKADKTGVSELLNDKEIMDRLQISLYSIIGRMI